LEIAVRVTRLRSNDTATIPIQLIVAASHRLTLGWTDAHAAVLKAAKSQPPARYQLEDKCSKARMLVCSVLGPTSGTFQSLFAPVTHPQAGSPNRFRRLIIVLAWI
jgi:hypothetical protein